MGTCGSPAMFGLVGSLPTNNGGTALSLPEADTIFVNPGEGKVGKDRGPAPSARRHETDT